MIILKEEEPGASNPRNLCLFKHEFSGLAHSYPSEQALLPRTQGLLGASSIHPLSPPLSVIKTIRVTRKT